MRAILLVLALLSAGSALAETIDFESSDGYTDSPCGTLWLSGVETGGFNFSSFCYMKVLSDDNGNTFLAGDALGGPQSIVMESVSGPIACSRYGATWYECNLENSGY